MSDRMKAIYDKLAAEGGGTWAAYMMLDIEEAFAERQGSLDWRVFKPADVLAWPLGCHDPESCARHKSCMYVRCSHGGKDIASEIERAQRMTNGHS